MFLTYHGVLDLIAQDDGLLDKVGPVIKLQ
jgi:hypothetical protein